jgi:hypothetical protein
VSRHHIQPPAVYMPPPPKPKETRRRRNVGHAQATGAVDEASETDATVEAACANEARAAGASQQQIPVEGAERKIPSPNGKLSDETLKAMLEVQELDSGNEPGSS